MIDGGLATELIRAGFSIDVSYVISDGAEVTINNYSSRQLLDIK